MSEKVAPLPAAWARAMTQPEDEDEMRAYAEDFRAHEAQRASEYKNAALAFVGDRLEIAMRRDTPTIIVTGQSTPVLTGPLPSGFKFDPGVKMVFKNGPEVERWLRIMQNIHDACTADEVLAALALDWSRK